MSAPVIWIIVAVFFAVAEMFSGALIALYFAIGSVAAAIVAAADGNTALQLVVFAATSIALLALTRPFIAKRFLQPAVPSNASTIVGRRAIVTIAIDNDANTGQVRVGTEYWTARAADGIEGVIAADTKVAIVQVAGVTAYVEPLPMPPVV